MRGSDLRNAAGLSGLPGRGTKDEPDAARLQTQVGQWCRTASLHFRTSFMAAWKPRSMEVAERFPEPASIQQLLRECARQSPRVKRESVIHVSSILRS